MAKRKQGKLWTPGTLKSRGWTEALMKKLLPAPYFRRFDGHSIRAWPKDAVTAAEASPEFQAAHLAEITWNTLGQKGRDSILQETAAFLQAAWDAFPKPDGPDTALAGEYHRAILHALPSAGKGLPVPDGQASSYVSRFLSLESAPFRQESGDLQRFVLAGIWVVQNPTSPLTVQLSRHYGSVLLALSGQEIKAFTAAQPEADLSALLEMKKFPFQQLLTHSLGYLYSVSYIPQAIRTSLALLVALNPKDEYPEARAMSRHFILHIGGTNTGKTYAGFQQLRQAKTGVYLAPLRLLALEAQEAMLDQGVACSLTTGEEEDVREGDTHVAATAEKLNLKQAYDVAVIDECQMISDRQRGYAWTRAILGVQAPEVHLCAAPEAKELLLRLIDSCGDTYEVEVHHRKVPLLCMNHVVDYTRVQPGDALITFSKVGVLSVAEDLRQMGKEPSIIYGALPYSTRRKQMEGFLSGRMEYVVSTDAIGMGLNLPIRRILFMDTQKFDGVEQRDLKPEEIQQIAGRAGRYGMYDKGYVGATQNLGAIRAGLSTVVPPLEHAVVGFSDLVLTVDFDLLEVLEVWNRMPTVEPYVKLDISRYITVISKLRELGFVLTKEQELKAANIPFDETEEALNELFHHMLRLYLQGEPIPRPLLPEDSSGGFTLPELELHCRKLDLYFSFSKSFQCPVDVDALYDEREEIAEQINQILLYHLKNNIRFCALCGKALPLHHHGRLCESCFRKRRQRAGPFNHSPSRF